MVTVKKIQKARDKGLKEHFVRYFPTYHLDKWVSVIKCFKTGDIVPSDAMYLNSTQDGDFVFLVKKRSPRHISELENNIIYVLTSLSKEFIEDSVEDISISLVKDCVDLIFSSPEEKDWFFSKRTVNIQLVDKKSVIEVNFETPIVEGKGELKIERV